MDSQINQIKNKMSKKYKTKQKLVESAMQEI